MPTPRAPKPRERTQAPMLHAPRRRGGASIAAATRRHVPVAVVSGRISERSLPRYQKVAPLLRSTFERLRAVGARSDADNL